MLLPSYHILLDKNIVIYQQTWPCVGNGNEYGIVVFNKVNPPTLSNIFL